MRKSWNRLLVFVFVCFLIIILKNIKQTKPKEACQTDSVLTQNPIVAKLLKPRSLMLTGTAYRAR